MLGITAGAAVFLAGIAAGLELASKRRSAHQERLDVAAHLRHAEELMLRVLPGCHSRWASGALRSARRAVLAGEHEGAATRWGSEQ